MSRPQLSPDGKSIAFLAGTPEGTTVAILDLATSKTRLHRYQTGSKDSDSVYWCQWINSERILFAGAERDLIGGLFAINRDGTQFKTLVAPTIDQAWQGKAAALASFQSFIPGDPDHILVELNRLTGLETGSGIYKCNVHTGRREIVQANFANIVDWVVDHQGNVRIAADLRADRVVYHHRAVGAKTWEPVAEVFLSGASFDPIAFDASGDRLYVQSDRNSNTEAIYAFDPRTREFGPPIFNAGNFDLESTGSGLLTFSPKDQSLLAITYHAEKPRVEPLDPKFRSIQKAIDGALPGNFNQVISLAQDGVTGIVLSTSDRDPGTYLIANFDRMEMSVVGKRCPWIDPAKMAATRPISFKSRDGLLIHGYLTLPPGGATNHLPMVVHPHGGPRVRDAWEFDPDVQFLANRGYAVLQVNFRGSTGYGRQFAEAGYHEWGARMQDDITDGVQWAIESGYADPKRVAIYGASYGGYAALAGLCFTPELYRCGVSLCGVTDMRSFIRGIPERRTLLRNNMERLVGDPAREGKDMKSRSPVDNADKIRVPVFIAHGELDSKVPAEQSARMVKALKKNRVPVTAMFKDNEGHGFSKPQNIREFHDALDKFLAEHLGK